MNGFLKGLVAAACVCVVALSMHYGYRQYISHQEQTRRSSAEAEATRLRIREAAKLADERRAQDEQALRDECSRRVPSQSTDNLRRLYEQCLVDNRALVGVTIN